MEAKLTEDQRIGLNYLIEQYGAANLSIVEAKQRQRYIQLLVHVWDTDKTTYHIRSVFNVPLDTDPMHVLALCRACERYLEQSLMHI